jgi:methionyl-tRNA formyltransferase
MGATIHEIDALIDHGNIICRTIVPSYSWDTSLSAYNRILDAEMVLLEEHLGSILNNTYKTIVPENAGNLYLKKDFNNLCKLDLTEQNTLGYFVNKLRALTHGDLKNAYFIDPVEGKKVYVRLTLEPVDDVKKG